jgi:membrane-bound inhibitor of C-type lysozyme
MKQHEAQDVGMVRVVLHGQTCHLHEAIGDEPTACGAATDSPIIAWWNRDDVPTNLTERGYEPCQRQGCFGTNEHLLEEAAA